MGNLPTQQCNCGANHGEGHLITCPQSPANHPTSKEQTVRKAFETACPGAVGLWIEGESKYAGLYVQKSFERFHEGWAAAADSLTTRLTQAEAQIERLTRLNEGLVRDFNTLLVDGSNKDSDNKRLRAALEWLRANWYPSHQHWDPAGTSGNNCRQCASDRAARERIRIALSGDSQPSAFEQSSPRAYMDETEADSHAFENFHRLLCERFDYTHDEKNWRRDRLSLIEHISASMRPENSADPRSCQEPDGCPTEAAVLKQFWRLHQSCLDTVGHPENGKAD